MASKAVFHGNLAYELYQSQCLMPDGLLQSTAWRRHPSSPDSVERQEYRELGETAYLDTKRQQFRQAVAANPLDFLDRVATRLFAATVWYMPLNRSAAAQWPWRLWVRRLAHPLPFLALLFLLWSGTRVPLGWVQWSVIGVYLLYLAPYVATSYYERYAAPLVAVKTLLLVWAVDRLWTGPAPHRAEAPRETP